LADKYLLASKKKQWKYLSSIASVIRGKIYHFRGMARGYTAIGDTKNAIKNWEIAIKNLPENQKQNLSFYESELKKLKGGGV
jgi:hypothetical protein